MAATRAWQPEFAEALGVFALVFAGCGAAVVEAQTGALGAVGVALTFAFTIVVFVYALGHVCGAHFNPAITIAFAATGHFPWKRVPTYLAAQVAGAALAAFLLVALLGPVGDAGAVRLAPGLAPWRGFGLEVVATFFLAFVIVAVATDRRATHGANGLAIGLAVGVGSLFAGPLTGAAMNPARALGPALASGQSADLWLYFAAPAAGAVLAMFAYEALRPGNLGIKAREPLGSLGPFALDEGPPMPRLRVMFACVGNSARSQMAEGFARALGGDKVEVMSGGSKPAGRLLPEAVQAMRERGIDISRQWSKPIDEAFVRRADLVVTMGCGDDACHAFIGKRIEDWELPDPAGKGLEDTRVVRDAVEARVRELLGRHGALR